MVEHALHGVRLVLIAIAVTGFLVAFLAECNAIQRCSYFLTGYFTSKNKGVKPHGFRAVCPFGFMCRVCQFIHSFFFNGTDAGPLPIFLKSSVPFVSVDLDSESQFGK